ncbi:MAG: hypothetical protein QOJ98_2799 [Acidobacteriota bacterium]|jgi:hypothetical protein|nr:hypothetical protein [Acidobacteriota bacterium]
MTTKIKVKRMPVSATNINKAALRLLPQRLVSTEIDYILRTMTSTSTQEEIDANVLGVRQLPWSSIVVAE